MKKSMVLCAIAFIAVVIFQASGAAAQTASTNLVLTKQSPYPVEPGQVVDIEVSLQNNGTGIQENIVLEIVPQPPFTLLPGEDITETFSKIDPYDSVSKSYKLKVDESAVSANYDLEFRYYQLGTTSRIIKDLSITVQGTPKVVVTDVRTEPETMKPGDEVEVHVYLKNEGTGEASQTELALVTEADADTEETMITPVLSGGIVYVGQLGVNEEKIAIFTLYIDNDAEYKSYLSTLTIDYKDESGTSNSVTYDLGLPVKGNPVIEVLSAKIDNSAYKVDIENIGTANAKALKIALIQDGEIKDSSVANELRPTKHKTIRFQGFRFGDALINISYLDEKNELFTYELPVTIARPLYAEESAGADFSSAALILLVLVIIEAYYIRRLRKRLKKR